VRAALLLAVALLLAPVSATAQRVSLSLDSRDLYAGLPFVLLVTAQGFDEEPAPAPPDLEIAGCKIHFLGMSPSVSSRLHIVNGRRSESRTVSFVYRYRIEAISVGEFDVPALTITQGSTQATSQAGRFSVKEIATTRDMKLVLGLPARQVYVGETFEVTLDWYLRRNVADQNFIVPLFDREDAVTIDAPPAEGRSVLKFAAGSRDIELPFEREQQRLGGVDYTRFRIHALVTANAAGALELEPARVVASLEGGVGRDSFGFPVRSQKLYKAEDEPRRLSVRPLPQAGRPASFSNAIGTAFSIRVRASRTVVAVGDPIELQIEVRGDGRLEGVSLPPTHDGMGLPQALFSVPDDSAAGEIGEQGKGKTFPITVRLRSAEAREIPALAFSYFDPQAGEYRTVSSEPIALQVAGSTMVGAADVVGAQPPSMRSGDDGSASSEPALMPASLVGADLSLSSPADSARSVIEVGDIRWLLVLLYLGPIAVLGVRIWLVRTGAERGRASELRAAVLAAERALEAASRGPARDTAPALITALRALARTAGHDEGEARAALARLENEAFDPRAAAQPLDGALCTEVRDLVARWSRARAEGAPRARAAHALVALLVIASATSVRAEPPAESARAVYQRALSEPDRIRRTRTFVEAQALMQAAAASQPGRPALLTDWGNAALGAGDLGGATLAYRRALHLDPTDERALKNLAWVRSRAPRWLPQPSGGGVVESLFFWHHSMSVAHRHLIGAISFALAILLCAPWPTSGAELAVLEERDSWSRVTLADGTRGWLRSHTIERVVPSG